jgi:hypothetical protein
MRQNRKEAKENKQCRRNDGEKGEKDKNTQDNILW